MGPTALFPLRRCAKDFITLKIHRPRPGLNPRTLGPVASTLTTRPVYHLVLHERRPLVVTALWNRLPVGVYLMFSGNTQSSLIRIRFLCYDTHRATSSVSYSVFLYALTKLQTYPLLQWICGSLKGLHSQQVYSFLFVYLRVFMTKRNRLSNKMTGSQNHDF
jgi:hypothetical protein